MKVRIIDNVTFEGSEIKDGEIELSDASAAALVAEGRAEYLDAEPVNDGDGLYPEVVAAEAIALQKKALDAMYKRDELADAAKNVEVEFAFDAKKADIIEAVVAAGKAEALLA